MTAASYSEKFEKIVGGGLYQYLSDTSKEVVKLLAFEYQFSLQELRIVCEIVCDFNMWGIDNWHENLSFQFKPQETLSQRKKHFLEALRSFYVSQVNSEKQYVPTCQPPSQCKLNLILQHSTSNIFGDCPVCSDRTVCCGLKTLDAVRNCGFACSYCTIQTFYGEHTNIIFDADLKEKLSQIKLDPNEFYHIGTGQASDSLLWGNHAELLSSLFDFAANHPNILLELKTKSAKIDYFINHLVPKNVVCSWSLNTDTIINNEEHFTVSLKERLRAARSVADCGVKVAFHFHPMVFYAGWQDEYAKVAQTVMKMFEPSEVHFISMGTLTFIKPVLQQIRRRGGSSKILQMPMTTDPHGKMTYPDEIKLQLFRHLDHEFRSWHGKTFFYLCMEKSAIWDALWGWHFTDRKEFLSKFKL